MPRPQRTARSRRVPPSSKVLQNVIEGTPKKSQPDLELVSSPPVMSSTPVRALRDISNSPTKKPAQEQQKLKSASNITRRNVTGLSQQRELGASGGVIGEDQTSIDDSTRFMPIRRRGAGLHKQLRSTGLPSVPAKEVTPSQGIEDGGDDNDDPFGFSKVDRMPGLVPEFMAPVKVQVHADEIPSSPLSSLHSASDAEPGSPLDTAAYLVDDDEEVDKNISNNNDDNGNDDLVLHEEQTIVTEASVQPVKKHKPYLPPTTDELLSILPPRKYMPPSRPATSAHQDDEDEEEDEESNEESSILDSETSQDEDDDDSDLDYGKPKKRRAKAKPKKNVPALKRSKLNQKRATSSHSDNDVTYGSKNKINDTNSKQQQHQENKHDDDDDDEDDDGVERSFILPQDESLDEYNQKLKEKFAEIDQWQLVVETVSEESLMESSQ